MRSSAAQVGAFEKLRLSGLQLSGVSEFALGSFNRGLKEPARRGLVERSGGSWRIGEVMGERKEGSVSDIDIGRVPPLVGGASCCCCCCCWVNAVRLAADAAAATSG